MVCSYSEAITKNHVTGEVLLSMKSKDDWKEVGITTFGDVRILLSKVSTLLPGISSFLIFLYFIINNERRWWTQLM